MTLIRAQQHSYLDAIVSGVGAATTVSAGPDNGANNQVACGFWKSMRHHTTKEAVDNFLSRISKNLAAATDSDLDILAKGIGQLNICGHGSDGFFTTGSGQDGQQDYKTNTMATWNEFWWGTEFDRLKGKNFTILTFWSCHTGAGDEGADFLHAVAKRIGLPTRGNTGWMYSNSRCKVWLEKGAQWQVATPDRRPPAIPAPTPHAVLVPVHETQAASEANEMIDSRISIGFTLSRRDTTDRQKFIEIEIPEEVQGELIRELSGSDVLELPGQALGYLTHKIRINQEEGVHLDFGVMNGRMIVNSDETRGIMVPPKLRKFLS